MFPLAPSRDPTIAQSHKYLRQWTSNSLELPFWQLIKAARHPENREIALGSPEHCSDSGEDPLPQQRWKKQFCGLFPAPICASKLQTHETGTNSVFLLASFPKCQYYAWHIVGTQKCLLHKWKKMTDTIFVAWHPCGKRRKVCAYSFNINNYLASSL